MSSTPIARQKRRKPKKELEWSWEDTAILLMLLLAMGGVSYAITSFQLDRYATHEEVMKDKAILVMSLSGRLDVLEDEFKMTLLAKNKSDRAIDNLLNCGNGWEFRGDIQPPFEICDKILQLEKELTSEERINNDLPSCDAGQTSRRTKQGNAKTKGEPSPRRH